VSLMVFAFPKNFDLLHRGQEHIRELSKAAIAESDVLLRHFNAIAESLSLIDHFSRAYAHTGEDHLTIRLLGIRLFNSAAGGRPRSNGRILSERRDASARSLGGLVSP
jgi:hypothetical protein